MNIQELYSLKKYARQGSPALSNEEYFGPAIDELLKYVNESDITVKVSHPVENANEDNTINKSYARAIVQAKMPHFDVIESGLTLGMCVALDKQVPEFTTYMGYEIFACTNLCIAADEDVLRYKDNHTVAQSTFKGYFNRFNELKENYINFNNKLQEKDLSLEELDTTVGNVLRKVITKHKNIGQSSITSAYKKILTPGTHYSLKNKSTNLWNLYNAVTDSYSDKFKNNTGLVERPIKTKELTKLFLNLAN